MRPLAGTAVGLAMVAALGGCDEPTTVPTGAPLLASTGSTAATATATDGTGTTARAVASATSEPDPAPAGARLLAVPLGAEAEVLSKVAAVDLNGDGSEEIAIASARGIAVLRPPPPGSAGTSIELWRGTARGGANAIASGDLDGDGRTDLVVGWGMHRDHRTAPATLVAYLTKGAAPGTYREEVVATPETGRAQFASLSVTTLDAADAAPGVLYASFVSKYEVRASFASPGSTGKWSERSLDVVRMGWIWRAGRVGETDRTKAPDVFVGRPYGDAPKSDGDVFVWESGGSRSPLPTTRGVRSLEVVSVGPVDDPIRLVCYGDGWHWMYGENAEGLLTCATPGAGGVWSPIRVDDTDTYEVNSIAAGDLDGDGVRELYGLTPTASYAYVPRREPEGALTWSRRTLGPGGNDFAVVDTDGDGRSELVLAGEKPMLLRMP